MRPKKTIPYHTIFFAAYPTIALLAHNIEEVRILDAARILLVSLGLALNGTWIAFPIYQTRQHERSNTLQIQALD